MHRRLDKRKGFSLKASRAPAGNGSLHHRIRRDDAAARLSPMVSDVLGSPSQPLDSSVRGFMQSRLGHDFRHVRVHANRRAAASARAFNARAYTVGRHLVFAAGQYAPASDAGRRLLAHELVHVVQQGLGPAKARAVNSDRHMEHPARARSAGIKSLGAAAGLDLSGLTPPRAPVMQRQPFPNLPDVDVTLRPPPFLARSMGSLTLDKFDLDSAALTSEHQTKLAVFAETAQRLLSAYPGGMFVITGHADATGTERHNERLGQRRADAVRDALAAAGVSATGMISLSQGESALRVETEEAEPRNRRVEITFDTGTPSMLFPPPTLGVPELTPPSPSERSGDGGPIEIVPRDPCVIYPPLCQEETPEEAGERIFRPIPPLPRRERRSISGRVLGQVDRAIDTVLDRLNVPDVLRAPIKNGARALVERGASEGLDRAMDAAGLTGEAREAVRESIRGVVQVPF